MLTERIIRDATPESKPHFLWDRQVTGLGCKVAPTGRKTFVLYYRVGGRSRLATLGRCSDMALRDARDLARDELTRLRKGEPDILERRRRERGAPTVNDALERFFDETVPQRIAMGKFTERTKREYRKHAERYVVPALGTLRVSAVTRHDVEKLAATLLDRPSQRNHVLSFLSRLFNLTERWEWRPQHTNPARGIERGHEEPRRRILSADEFAALSRALKGAEEARRPSVAAVRVAALTGLRISEVIAMRWTDIDFKSGRVHLPTTKTGARMHDLPAAALAQIQLCLHLNDFVFTYGRSAPVTYRTIRAHFAEIVAEAGLVDVRLHDLRRTLITAAAAGGESVFVIRGLLGHKTTAMAARYVQEAGLAVREARQKAGRTIAEMMDVTTDDEGPESMDDTSEAGSQDRG